MWIITKDRINAVEEMNRTGVHSWDYEAERFEAADTLPIRLLDDNGELYYEGRMTRERLESSEEHVFEMLDWAMADAGCTELQFFEKGVWHTL